MSLPSNLAELGLYDIELRGVLGPPPSAVEAARDSVLTSD